MARNRYLEKIAALSVVGKSWVRDVLPKLSKHSISSLTTVNDKAKTLKGSNISKVGNPIKTMTSFKNGNIVKNTKKKSMPTL